MKSKITLAITMIISTILLIVSILRLNGVSDIFRWTGKNAND